MYRQSPRSLLNQISASIPPLVIELTVRANDLPTNTELIAAMPEEVESVLLLRASVIMKEACPLRSDLAHFFGEPPRGEEIHCDWFLPTRDEFGLDRIVYESVARLEPEVRLVAGAQFLPPKSLGLGRFHYLSVWVTRQSNVSLRHRIETQLDIAGDVVVKIVDGVSVFTTRLQVGGFEPGDEPEGVDYALVFFSDQVLIVGEGIQNVVESAKSLKRGSKAVPSRWASAASALDLESPILILRAFGDEALCYVEDTTDPRNPKIGNAKIDALGLTGTGQQLQFKLRCITHEPEAAVQALHGGGLRAGFMPYAWDWKRDVDATGFTAQITILSGNLDVVEDCWRAGRWPWGVWFGVAACRGRLPSRMERARTAASA
jgi:hypothetical protein